MRDSIVNLIKRDDPQFPPLFREIGNCPEAVYVKGDVGILGEAVLRVAIVGTRKASAVGRKIAEQLAKELAGRGVVIVSGLAFGIDQAAHRGCLAGGGRTVAVLAGGLDKIYPQEHFSLAEEILEKGGALISEYPPGTPSFAQQFLQRNRLISGLVQAVIIVEAPEKSGALNTAAHALEQNREVFIVPGPINHPNYVGSHRLIRDGATLITGASDILEALGLASNGGQSYKLTPEGEQVATVINQAGKSLSVDEIYQLTGLPLPVVNQTLALLLVEGAIIEENGKYIII